jgi:hypothetical protein
MIETGGCAWQVAGIALIALSFIVVAFIMRAMTGIIA